MEISAIGIDLAKNVFQVHGADKFGKPVLRRTLSRGKVLGYFSRLKPCLVGMEACSSSHYWARERRRDKRAHRTNKQAASNAR